MLHTFKARSVAEALRLVREELGPDACVLKTRSIGSLWSRWLSSDEIEVTATADARLPSRLPQAEGRVHEQQRNAPARSNPSEFSPPPAELHDYRRQVREDLSRQSDSESSFIEQLCDPTEVPLQRIPIRGPIRLEPGSRKAVALVGPTGVGKTTTIAKLAAHFRLQAGLRVALITIDTFRIAAVEQLRTYAEIMDLPLAVVATPREMQAALGKLVESELVLIDTPGHSPRDLARLQQLKAMLASARLDEVHLVLSAVAGAQSQHAAAATFAGVGPSALVLTKLDEAESLAWLPKLAFQHRLPLSYATSGQNVPDDLQPASAELLTQWNSRLRLPKT